MSKHIYKNDSGSSSYIASISNGGTGGASAAQAADKLGLLTTDMLGVEKGLALLESVSGQPVLSMVTLGDEAIVNRVSVIGLTNADINTQQTYTIVNYDSFTKYVVVAINGSVDSVNGAEIRYTTPALPGECGFTINGQKILLRAIAGAYVNPPTITSPVNNSLDKGPDATITTSPFQTTGGTDNHLSTDYHIAEDPLFETGFVTYSNQIAGKTSFTIPSLQAVKTYYIRARHRGEMLSVSGWSAVVMFTTKTVYKPNKPSITSPLNAQEGLGPNLTATSSTYSLTGSSGSSLADVEWQLSKSNTFSPLINSSSETGLNAIWNNIDYASTYYLRMRHTSNIGTTPSDWSDVISFMSGAIPNPNTPTITAPVGQQDIDVILTADAFHSDVGETHASSTWQISTDSSFATIVSTKSVTNSTTHLTTYTVLGLNTATTYYARVSYKSDQGRSTAFSAPVSFNTLGVLVDTPTITFVSGADPYLNALSSYYVANDSAGPVSKMHWQVYSTSDFTSGVVYDQEDSYNGTGNPSLTGIYLPPSTVLYFRMRYKSANGFYSGYSNVLTSTSRSYLTAPTLNTTTVAEATGTFSWNRGSNTVVGVGTSYRFSLYPTSDFSGVGIDINTISTTINATLVYGTTYYWKVEQTDTLTSAGYTEVKTSTTGTVSVGAQPVVIYNITSSVDTYNEGQVATFILTKSRDDGSGDHIDVSGTAIRNFDYTVSGADIGMLSITPIAQNVINIPTIADNSTDGDKSLTLVWRTGSGSGPIVASKTVWISDTSLTPGPVVNSPIITTTDSTGPGVSFTSTVYSANSSAGELISAVWEWSAFADFSQFNYWDSPITGNAYTTNFSNHYLPAHSDMYVRLRLISSSGAAGLSNVVTVSQYQTYVFVGAVTSPQPNGVIDPTYGDIAISPTTSVFSNLSGFTGETYLKLWKVGNPETSASLIGGSYVDYAGQSYGLLGLEYGQSYYAKVRSVVSADFLLGRFYASEESGAIIFQTRPHSAYIVNQTQVTSIENIGLINGGPYSYFKITGKFILQPGTVLFAVSASYNESYALFGGCTFGAPSTITDPIYNSLFGHHREYVSQSGLNDVNGVIFKEIMQSAINPVQPFNGWSLAHFAYSYPASVKINGAGGFFEIVTNNTPDGSGV